MRIDKLLAIGDTLTFGLWDNKQIPVRVKALIDGYPSSFEVTQTIPHFCVKGAIITYDKGDREEMRKALGNK